MTDFIKLSAMQEVRLNIVNSLIHTGRYSSSMTKGLIDDAAEIVKYIDRGELYRCDGVDSMKQNMPES